MEEISKHDIYSKNGKLLLAKGKKITENVMSALDKFGDTGDTEIQQADSKIEQISNTINDKINPRYHNALEYPSELLKKIIFESKDEPWWIFINLLANYVEWVYEHSIDVALISAMIGMQLKYSPQDIWVISLGSLLHDVGKLLIPKNIIQKKGPLTDEEWRLVYRHCELGVLSLKPYGLKKETLQIILGHHERLDGSGYPAGLKGNDIHPFAQIVMVADVIDAITSYRPYKEIQSMEEAIKTLRDGKTQYPHEIVKIVGDMFL